MNLNDDAIANGWTRSVSNCGVPRDLIYTPHAFIAKLVIIIFLYEMRLGLGIHPLVFPNAFA